MSLLLKLSARARSILCSGGEFYPFPDRAACHFLGCTLELGTAQQSPGSDRQPKHLLPRLHGLRFNQSWRLYRDFGQCGFCRSLGCFRPRHGARLRQYHPLITRYVRRGLCACRRSAERVVSAGAAGFLFTNCTTMPRALATVPFLGRPSYCTARPGCSAACT